MYQLSNTYRLRVQSPRGELTGVVGISSDQPWHNADFLALVNEGSGRSVSVRANDTERTAGHGTYGGPNRLGSQSWHFELFVVEQSAAKRADYFDQLNEIFYWGLNGGVTVEWEEANGNGPGAVLKQASGLKTAQMPTITHQTGPTKLVTCQLDGGFPFVTDQRLQQQTRKPGGQLLLDNSGTAPMYPVYYVFGPCSAFELQSADTGHTLRLPYDVADGDYVRVDMRSATVLLNGTTDVSGELDLVKNQFFAAPGRGLWRVNFTADDPGANTKVRADYRYTWVQ